MSIGPWIIQGEQRAAYTDTLVSLLQSRAAGNTHASVHQTAALEACSRIVGRALPVAASHEYHGPLPDIKRRVWLTMSVKRAVFSCSQFPSGGHQRQQWPRQWGVCPAPGGTEKKRTVAAESVLSFLYAVHPGRPWVRCSPLNWRHPWQPMPAGNSPMRLQAPSAQMRIDILCHSDALPAYRCISVPEACGHMATMPVAAFLNQVPAHTQVFRWAFRRCQPRILPHCQYRNAPFAIYQDAPVPLARN